MAKKNLPEATMQRQENAPHYWVLTENQSGAIIDIDQYQNDLRPRWEKLYNITKIGI